MKIRLILVLLIVNFLVACETTPTGRSQLAFMPDDKMDAMGLQAFDNLKKEKPISQNNREIQFVQCIADAITQEIEGDWEVVVFGDETLNGDLANVIVRNWGFLVTGLGILLIYGAYNPQYRSLILIIASASKTVFIVSFISYGYLEEAALAIITDSIIVLFSVFYLLNLRNSELQ